MESSINSYDSAKLFYRILRPKMSPKAAVIIVHGFGDHSGGMENISTSLAEKRYIVYAYDLRGHGKSSGKRGYIQNWHEFRGDLARVHNLVASEQPDLPIFLVGHSMGGVIVLDYVLGRKEGIHGVVAISPAISYKATPLERFGVTVMGKIKPDFCYTKRGNFHLKSKNGTVQGKESLNSLRHNTITPGLGRALLKTIVRVEKDAQSIKLPILMQYGLEDKITPPGKLRAFFGKIGSKDKKVFEYPATKHRPFDEEGKEQMLANLMNWLDQQTIEKRTGFFQSVGKL